MIKNCKDCYYAVTLSDGKLCCRKGNGFRKADMVCGDFEAKLQTEPKADLVSHPKHYLKGGLECIEAIKAVVTGLEPFEAVCTANILKYVWRWKDKNGIEDLKKCRWYLDRLIKEVEHGKLS
jgi:hypothetical protein